ncbi:MAG: hypothetical protein M1821_003842 [Bathelium mastoideum]|nr:MAG: hypothetical protein M1821_003842 [Bathelium mastoideum]
MAPTPGILYVKMQPAASLPANQFHDWYNNEHGPLRVRLPYCQNGFRYRAADGQEPEWMAVYDFGNTADLASEESYTKLRLPGVASQREFDVKSHVSIDRRMYDLVETKQSPDFKRLEDVNSVGEENVCFAIGFTIKPGKDVKELEKWYSEEHIPLLAKVPGWRRSRRFLTSAVEDSGKTEHLALHDYAPQNGVGTSEEYKAATNTPWREQVMRDLVDEKTRRQYNLYYTFGPCPRDLTSLVSDWSYTDAKTTTRPASSGKRGVIESYITTKDGVDLPYRLEGSSDPNAPLILLSNSILADWGIWDDFVDAFFSANGNGRYRVLRYNTRGRSKHCGEQTISLDLLTSDIISLLDALRVPKAATVMGVSLGGATTLNAALKYPDRVASLISCDTNTKAPASNPKAWGERIEVAEKEGAQTQSGEKVVGEQLAEMTVRRWCVPESYDGGEAEAKIGKVKRMVHENSLDGFKKAVQALFEYDISEDMKNASVRAAFVVGGGDGILPNTMKEMSAEYGKGAEFVVIDGAGHLPMVEKPKEVASFVTNFLHT